MQTTTIIVIALAALWVFYSYVASLVSAKKEVDLQICTGCDDCFDIKTMLRDDDCDWFCKSCYDELLPVIAREYAEMVARGEIEVEEKDKSVMQECYKGFGLCKCTGLCRENC